MKTPTFLTIAGAVSIAATAGFADSNAGSPMSAENLISVDQIDDAKIYRMEVTTDDTWSNATMFDGIQAEWVSVGEIEEVLLDRSGKMVAVLASIGGFLDIGDRDVIIPLENVKFSADTDKNYAFVTNMTEAELEALPEVDEDFWD